MRALVYPGQGAQYVGMGMELAHQFPLARQLLDEADAVLGFAISDIIAHGPDDDLVRTDISQPAILVTSWMAHCVVTESFKPFAFAATAGLSLGEYTALLAAGAFTFADALRLVRLRGQAMQEAADASAGTMVALIGIDEEQAITFCDAIRQDDEVLQVANLNSTGQVVIAGDTAACERAATAAKEHGIRRAMPLKVAGAFHTPHMAPAAERLSAALADTAIQDPRVPVYTNVTAQPVTQASEVADFLVRQLTSPVRWADCMIAMHAAGCTNFLELGPGKSLCGMIARTVKEATASNVDGPDDVTTLAK